MNLPFTPSFFREMDIYQKLREYESEKGENSWTFEKLFLMWVYKHHYPGRIVGSNEIETVTEKAVNEKTITSKELKKQPGTNVLLDSLHHRGFTDEAQKDNCAVINRDGYIAGKVLIATDGLRKNIKYDAIRIFWWLILIAGSLALLLQVINLFIDLMVRLKTVF
jgi:hypothetical protein